MRFGIALSLSLMLLAGCTKSPEEVASTITRSEQSKAANIALLAEKKTSNTCYVAIYLWYAEGDDSVAAAAAELGNAVKDDWYVIGYNVEFSTSRTALLKNKTC